ncbi:putative E3 ubiquitin-protein ligase RING1a [Spatholobus suberectus]|nr:putative E3 ubiquitin-protein ligase RING1a [Spatholobus suberectus]
MHIQETPIEEKKNLTQHITALFIFLLKTFREGFSIGISKGGIASDSVTLALEASIIRKTRAVMECMHRFCRDCIEKSFRLGNNECPACRTHCSSRRSLREDPNFDALISILYPNIDEYEEEVVFVISKRMQKAYSKTFKRQRAALGKKRATAAFMKRSKVKYLRSSNRRRRRNFRNATEIAESSSTRGSALSPISEERETEVIPDSDTSEAETETRSDKSEEEAQSPQPVVNNEVIIAERTGGDNIPEPEPIRDIVSSSTTLVWGRNGQRSNTRNARNVAASRSNRLARLIDHLHNSEQNDDELDIFIKLVSFEENRVPNLPRPYLSCRPTLSIKQLCQYVAYETSLQTEEIELYLVKECQPNVVSGDGKLDPDNDKSQFLGREEETLAELKTNNLNFGHLVIAYKRKRWNLNEVLS